MQLFCGCSVDEKGIPIDSNIIQEKMKPLYDNLQQKKGEGCEAREFSASKGWFDHFRERFGLRKCQDNRRSSVCQPRGSRGVHRWLLRKSLKRKDICPKYVFNADEISLFWGKKKSHKGYSLIRTGSKHQGLRLKQINLLFCVNSVAV